ncbi:hypothetical protein M011DRAFT_472164 [Sporormia fimetaria CBS 119925]|uniref:Nucleoporin protein Ndc1-Nup n=1 Tax=Sporormia fimetaria CBS 119925 TaxID=1340428 RepID=A0A6A6UXU5_9PLEO|nr:hypothetical protein M011DRAFT_472164 [Sporormia fimetaria CBS 119925]
MASLSPAPPRPYRDFVVPSRHRRFFRAALLTLCPCYLIAVWLGDLDSYIWSWFPLGFAGVRTFVITLSIIPLYLLRARQWHTGKRNSLSPWDTFWKQRFEVARVFVAYAASAFIYGLVYLSMRGADVGLGFTDPGKPHERTKLNERPIYFQFLLIVLACGQAAMHISRDYDRIPESKPGWGLKEEVSYMVVPVLSQAGIQAVCVWLVGSVVYFMGFRNWFWGYWYWTMEKVFSLAKTSRPTGLAPFLSLAIIFLAHGTLLTVLWNFGNTMFNLNMGKEPLRKGLPISATSNDPNGTLINGLKSKKEDYRNEAFQELALISGRFEERRKTIFAQYDRAKCPTARQMSDRCLDEIKAITRRIKTATDPSYRPDDEKTQQAPGPIQLVPQISQPIQETQTMPLAKPRATNIEKVKSLAGEIIMDPDTPGRVKFATRKAWVKGAGAKIGEGIQEATSTWASIHQWLSDSPVGSLFRTSIRRTANVVVLGTPYSRYATIASAITALKNLSVKSLVDDERGLYQDYIADIIRTLTIAIQNIESYMDTLDPTWSSKPAEERRRKVPEVQDLLVELKAGLGSVFGAFHEYLEGLKMSRAEIREVKKLVSGEQAPVGFMGR